MRRLRAGVLSAGAWSMTSHLPTLAADPDVDIVIVTRPDAERAEATATAFGVDRWSTDWRDALDLELDVVIVNSPPIAHPEQVIASLEAGAHVLVEKPFALDLAGARDMARAAESAHGSLLVGYGWTAVPMFQRVHELVASGVLGTLEHVALDLAVNNRALLTGVADAGWVGATDQPQISTYTDPSVAGGGSAAVAMSHEFGLLLWITGQQASTISARTYPVASRMDLHDACLVDLSSGVTAAVTCASTQPFPRDPQWTMRVYGDAAQVTLDSERGLVRIIRSDSSVEELDAAQVVSTYVPGAPTAALLACARGASAPTGMSAGLATEIVALTDAFYASALGGGALVEVAR